MKRNVSDVQRKNFTCSVEKIEQQENKQKKVFRFVASTSQPDRAEDIVELAGWDTKAWEKNPVILWGHGRTGGLPIGRGVNIQKDFEKQALVVDVEFTPKDDTNNPHLQFANAVEALVENGFIKAVSVGFLPKESEERQDVNDTDSWFPPMRYTQSELLEISIVNVPANPNALLVLNDMQREVLSEKGVFPMRVYSILFKDDDIYKNTEWAKENNFSVAKPVEYKGLKVYEQKDITEFDIESLKTLRIAPGVNAIVGDLVVSKEAPIVTSAVAFGIMPNTTSNSATTVKIVGGGTGGTVPPGAPKPPQPPQPKPTGGARSEAVDPEIKGLIQELSKAVVGLHETTKNIAATLEFIQGERVIESKPGSKSMGLADQYLSEAAKSMRGLTELVLSSNKK